MLHFFLNLFKENYIFISVYISKEKKLIILQIRGLLIKVIHWIILTIFN